MRLHKLIGEIGAKYDRLLPTSSEAHQLLNRAEAEFTQWIPRGYLVEGTGGKGKASATPRIAIFNPDETTTIRRGIYVAYLFAADKSTVTLTLNQGIGEMAEHLGRAGARMVLALEATAIRAAMSPKDIAGLDVTFDLRTTAASSVDYQHTNILSRTYRLDNLPRKSAMVSDLDLFIQLYALALDAREIARRHGRHERVALPRPSAAKKVTKKSASPETGPEVKKSAVEPSAGAVAKKDAVEPPAGAEVKKDAVGPSAGQAAKKTVEAQAILATKTDPGTRAGRGSKKAAEAPDSLSGKKALEAQAIPAAKSNAVEPAAKKSLEAQPKPEAADAKMTLSGPETSGKEREFETKMVERKQKRLTGSMTRRGMLAALVGAPIAFMVPKTNPPKTQAFIAQMPAPPETKPVFTIDVSQHDWRRRGGNLDWASIRHAGIAAMCARATYGDPSGYHWPTYNFGDFARAARNAGMALRGGYHNLVRGDQASINRQVDWLRRELDRYDANWAMLDIEHYSELASSDMWPRWDDVRRFDDRWAEVDSRVLVAYLPQWNWSKFLGQPDIREFRGPLIASNYPLNDTNEEYKLLYDRVGGNNGRGWAAYGNRTPDGWQYSSHAQVPGAPYICDINAWRMSYEQLRTLLLGARKAAARPDA